MFNKKIMVMSIIIACLLAVSAVSASDSMDNQVSTVNESVSSQEPVAIDDGQKENTLTMDDEYIHANLEMIDSPKDSGSDQVTFKLSDMADNSPLPNVDLCVLAFIPPEESAASQDDVLGVDVNSKPLAFMADVYDSAKITTNSKGIAVYTIPDIFDKEFKMIVGFYDDGWPSSGTEVKIAGVTKYLSTDLIETNMTSPIIKASLKLSKEGSYYNNVVLKASLIATNNKAISNETIQITFSNGKKVKVTTNSKGIATYKVPFGVGTYSATANVVSKKVTSNSTRLNNIVISKAPVTISPSKLATTYASGKYFQVKVINSKTKQTVPNVKLALKVYTGKKYKTVTVTTDSKGVAKYKASSLAIGTHKVVVSVKDTKNCAGSSKTSSIKIAKSKVSISAPDQLTVFKKGPSFKVKVLNNVSGKAVAGIVVTVKIAVGKNYKTMTAKTNSKGVAAFSTKGLSKGKHDIKISTKANGKYRAGSEKSSVRVLASKITTYFIINQGIRFILPSGLVLTTADVILRGTDGKYLIKPIKVYSPSHGTTAEKSGSGVPITLTYSQTFTFSFAGDGIYKPVSATHYMTVS